MGLQRILWGLPCGIADFRWCLLLMLLCYLGCEVAVEHENEGLRATVPDHFPEGSDGDGAYVEPMCPSVSGAEGDAAGSVARGVSAVEEEQGFVSAGISEELFGSCEDFS